MSATNDLVRTWMAVALFIGAASSVRANEMTFTGMVGDAMCGVKHKMNAPSETCTTECVNHGSDYALIMNDKAYTLKAPKKLKAALEKLAGQKVVVTGDQKDDTIQVSAVKAAM